MKTKHEKENKELKVSSSNFYYLFTNIKGYFDIIAIGVKS